MKDIKLTEEEKKQIQELNTNLATTYLELGHIESDIVLLQSQKNRVIHDLTDLRQIEANLNTKLGEKYGNGTIDIENGLIKV